MGRISAVGYLIALTASVLAGCAESDTAQPVSERSGVAEVRQPRTVSRAPEPDGPPACGDLGVPADSPDCRLRSRDPVGLAFTVRRTTVDGRTDATIEVAGPDGAATQTLAERDIRHPSDPSLRDIDGDGREELIVPLHLTTPNTRYAVYHASGAATELRRAGELTGVAIDTTADGYVASTARDAQLSWSVGFWRFADDVLTPPRHRPGAPGHRRHSRHRQHVHRGGRGRIVGHRAALAGGGTGTVLYRTGGTTYSPGLNIRAGFGNSPDVTSSARG